MRFSRIRVITAVIVAGTLALGGAVVARAASPAASAKTGKVYVWVSGSHARQPIVITGAIGDYGVAISETKSGRVTSNGAYVDIKLQNGSFHVNAKAFNKRTNALQPTVNTHTCSAWAHFSGPVTVYGGSGAYAGIGGTVRIASSFAAIFPRYAHGARKGQCKLGNSVQPLRAFSGNITGVGTLTL
jgi:hypothetical protein